MQYIIMITGGSGSGKTTLMKSLTKSKKIEHIITNTTRPKRTNEKDGVDYYFCDDASFDKLDLIESCEFNGYKYGISSKELYKSHKDLVIVIEPNGILQILNYIETQELKLIPIIIHLKIKEKERYKNMIKRGDDLLSAASRLENDEIDNDIERFEIKPNIVIKKMMPLLDKHIMAELIRLNN